MCLITIWIYFSSNQMAFNKYYLNYYNWIAFNNCLDCLKFLRSTWVAFNYCLNFILNLTALYLYFDISFKFLIFWYKMSRQFNVSFDCKAIIILMSGLSYYCLASRVLILFIYFLSLMPSFHHINSSNKKLYQNLMAFFFCLDK